MPIALVTGGSRGLGKEISLALSAAGYCVVINYLSSDKTAREFAEGLGGKSTAIKADVGNLKEVGEMAARIYKEFGRLDAVVNNAGTTADNLLLRQTEDEWDRIIGTNLKGCFNVIRSMAPLMIKTGGGTIINISSYSGVKGKRGQAAYSASKAGILGLTFSSAIELAEHNIRVNAVLPGYMMTEMGTKADKALQAAQKESILNRLSSSAEAAKFVLHLLNAENITGQVFSLDSRIV